jgi:hypothetical protein
MDYFQSVHLLQGCLQISFHVLALRALAIFHRKLNAIPVYNEVKAERRTHTGAYFKGRRDFQQEALHHSVAEGCLEGAFLVIYALHGIHASTSVHFEDIPLTSCRRFAG